MLTEIPLRQNPAQRQVASGFSVPPPVGGLNARDELANMDERDATLLDNLFPEANYASLRKGFISHATGLPAAVRTLMEWSGPTSRKLFAATSDKIYNVTASGAVGAADVSGLNTADWQYVNFTTSGGHFLKAVSGSDDPLNYDGSSWSTSPAITGSGLTASNLINVWVHKERLWFVEKDSTNAWYLPVQTLGGAASKVPLGSLFKLGGKLQNIGTISHDAGDGSDDYIAFISSRGEVAVYQGTNPASATTWSLVGVYRVGYPIGNKAVMDIAGDIGVITADGVVSVIKMMQLDRASAQQAAITNKIQTLFNQAVVAYSANYGWQGTVYPKGNRVLFNIPVSSTRYDQYVMNTITGSWCRFTNMNGVSWSLLGDSLFFGGANGVVYQADTGTQDNSGPITGDLRMAWNYFKTRGQNKLFTFMRPIIRSNGFPSVLMAMNTDFVETDPTGSINVGVTNDSLWGNAQWGVGTWGGDGTITTEWTTPGAVGYCGAIRMRITAQGQTFVINSFDVQAIVGGPL